MRGIAAAYDAAALSVLPFVQFARSLGAADFVQVGKFLQGNMAIPFYEVKSALPSLLRSEAVATRLHHSRHMPLK